jgi:hypothetical protein
MGFRYSRRLAGLALACASAVATAALATTAPATTTWAAPSCPVIDAYSVVAETAAATAGQPPEAQVAAFKASVIAAHPGLYAQTVLELPPGPHLDAAIVSSLAEARAAQDRPALARRMTALVAAASGAFAARFSDFHCDFPVYLTDSLSQLDGAGRLVDGRPALVLGIDALDNEQTLIALPVFVTHEMFHRYHQQAAGFSDDLAERQPIWRNLWAEGLATYASEALTPGATRAEALMLPRDLEQRAAPMTPALAADLLAHLDETNPEVFTTYFTFGSKAVAARGLPWRSGYYIGYRVAQKLARRHSLDALAHLKGDALHAEIVAALQELARGG